MRMLVDHLHRHAEPVSRWEFRIFATVGIAIALIVGCLLAYAESVGAEQTRTPAMWRRHASPQNC
jgi:hypothetical protein